MIGGEELASCRERIGLELAMHPECYEDSAKLFDNNQVVCPKRLDCDSLVQQYGYETTVQALGPSVVAIISCTFSVLGSLLIIYTYVRWKELRTGSRSIVTFLAIADLVTALGYIFGSANYISHYDGRENSAWCEQFNVICQIQSFITTTSSLSSFAWTSILALYLYLVIVKSKLVFARRLMPLFHIIAWLLPLLITLPLLFKQKLGYSAYAASNWCFVRDSLPNDDPEYLCGKLNYEVILLVLVAGKAWEIATYVLVIVLYTAIKWHIHKETRDEGSYQSIGESTMSTIQKADKKLTFIPIVFILLRIWGTLQFVYATGVNHMMYFGCVPKNYAVGFTFFAYVQSLGDGGQGWGNIFLYVISAPKIRERLFYCIRHPNLRYLLGLNFRSSPTSLSVSSSGLQGRKKSNQNSGVSVNNDETTSFTPTMERSDINIANKQ